MKNYLNLKIPAFLIILVLSLTACGGGGGSSSSSIYYAGSSGQASIKGPNAEDLLLGAYVGGEVGASAGALSVSSPDSTIDRPGVFAISQVLKNSLRELNTGQGDSRTRELLPGANNGQFPGDCGGVADYTITLDEGTGEFTGTFIYSNFCSGGMVLSGSVDFSGIYELLSGGSYNIKNYKVTFTTLSCSFGGAKLTMAGNITWTSATKDFAETLSMDMVFVDNQSFKTYWLNNYHITTTYGPDYISQHLSGRYYDHDEGYVDFDTAAPLLTTNGYVWPSQGVLVFTGANGSKGRLTFYNTFMQGEVDEDGDGVWEWSAAWGTNPPPPPPVNNPPVVDAGPDQTVKAGDQVALDGTGSTDPDGDALSYWWNFVSCPGSCPSLSSTTSVSPTFRPLLEGDYVLRLSVYDGKVSGQPDEVIISVNPVNPLNPSLLALEWKYGLYGTYIGRSGVSVFDLEGDGTTEIITAASSMAFGSNVFWYVVREISGGGYEQVWISDIYNSAISRILVADADGDGAGEIYVGLQNGTVLVYDGRTLTETASFNAGSNIDAMAVADADGDGAAEIVISDGVRIYLYSTVDLTKEWESASYGGTDLVVGNVDNDPAPEIVTTTNGGHGYVVDGISHALEWDFINGFGSRLELGDVDGDGLDEIVGAARWYKITIFDADIKTPAWEITTAIDIGGLLVADVDGDGVPDIVYGDRQWGYIHCVDTTTKAEKWATSVLSVMESGIAFGDVDSDGVGEVIWGAGGPSSGADHLTIADSATSVIEWQNIHIVGPLAAVDAGDVDDDGQDEIVMVSFKSNSGYREGTIHIFDGATHALEWTGPLGIQDFMGVSSVRIGDVDDDGQTEFVVTTADLYNGVIQVYNGTTHLLENQSAGYDGSFFTTLEIGDVDNDGKTEIAATNGIAHTGATGTYLIVLDGATLAEEWRSVSLVAGGSGVAADIELRDIDGDGNIEIITAYRGSRVYVYDGVTHQLDWLGDVAAEAVDTFDINGDSSPDILVGKTDGTVDVYSGADYSLLNTFWLPLGGRIDALQVDDVDQDGFYELIVSSSGRLSVFYLQTLDLLWQSGNLGANLGWYNQVLSRDIDGDGRKEIIVGSDFALYQFD